MFVLIRQFLAIFSLFWTEGAGTGAGVVWGGGGGRGGERGGNIFEAPKTTKTEDDIKTDKSKV